MNKIVIVGPKASGKTSYFYSALHKMMIIGCDRFNLHINSREQYRKLYQEIKTLGNTALSHKDRWPQASTYLETYELNLYYEMEKLDMLEWVEYPGTYTSISPNFPMSLELLNCPGEVLEYPDEQVSNRVDELFMDWLYRDTILFVCVDGTQLQFNEKKLRETEEELDYFTEEDINAELEREEISSEMIDKFGKRRSVAMVHYLKELAYDYYHQFGIEICNALAHAAESNEEKAYPPVCVLITKYDVVSLEFQDMELLTLFVKYCFPILFSKNNDNKHIVTICPVSLGKDIAKGGKLRPKYVERPIYFALYLSMSMQMKELESSIKLGEESRSYWTWIPKYWKTPWRWENEKQRQEEFSALINLLKQMLKELHKVVEVLPLYINGEKQNWPEY